MPLRPVRTEGSAGDPPAAPSPRVVAMPPQRRRRGRKRWIVLVLTLAAIGGGVAYEFRVRRPQAAQKAAGELQTVAVKRMDLGASTEAGGVVNAVRQVNLSPNVASRIERLYIREGDRVEAGQLVAEMESEQLQAKLNQVKAQLEGARAQLEGARAQVAAAGADAEVARARRARHEPLLASGAISLELMEELRNAERQAEIRVQETVIRVQEAGVRIEEARYAIQQSEAELRNTRVYAPFSGIITRLYAQEGQFVTPTTAASEGAGATSTSIAELSSGLEVVASLPEASLTDTEVGQTAEITTEAFPSQIFKGKVTSVSPRAVTENDVNSFPVRISIQSGFRSLKPAMNVRVKLLASPVVGVLVVPIASLAVDNSGRQGVYIFRETRKIDFVHVAPGRISGDLVQIEGNVNEGDKVILSAPKTASGMQTKPEMQ